MGSVTGCMLNISRKILGVSRFFCWFSTSKMYTNLKWYLTRLPALLQIKKNVLISHFLTMIEENFEIWWPECFQNALISHYLNDLLHHGWRKFWNLMTWMLPKRFNFTLFEWFSSPWLKKILKFDDLNASKTL